MSDKRASKEKILGSSKFLNQTILEPGEILSLNLYHYSRKTKEIDIIKKEDKGQCS